MPYVNEVNVGGQVYDIQAKAMDHTLSVSEGGTGAATANGARDNLDCDQRLKTGLAWADAVAAAKSELVVCVYNDNDVYTMTIPRAEITNVQKTFYQGGAYSAGSLNHVQVTVTTTAISVGWYYNGSFRSSNYRLYYR